MYANQELQEFIAIDEDRFGPLDHSLDRPMRVLLLKPYQEMYPTNYSPPLGLLYLASALRHRFGDRVEVKVIDQKVMNLKPETTRAVLREFAPDVVGVSALNCEAAASYEVCQISKEELPGVLTVVGGPFALRQAPLIFDESAFDWVIGGSAERVFSEALSRQFTDGKIGEDLPGLSYRREDGSLFITRNQENITNLDEVPLPAWDLVDLDVYTKVHNFAGMLKEKRYALLFTSRGCPYLCNYCHDIFSKKYVYQSVDRVIEEIENLVENFGVKEFQIVDDIFNLHKPRLKAIMEEVHRRWPGQLRFTFPNALRADILDQETIDALALGGTYHTCIAVETVTPRLQELVEKHLDIEKTRWAVDALEKAGISVMGFFMLGFPTETPEEIRATVDFALQSDMTMAQFFTVTPQPETPMYDLALKEGEAALLQASKDEREKNTYRDAKAWYQKNYGYPLDKEVRRAYILFHFHPRRVIKILRAWPLKSMLQILPGFLKTLMPFR